MYKHHEESAQKLREYFEGQEGVFVKVKGARDRRVVVAIRGVIAVALATVHPDLIEPLPPAEKEKGRKAAREA